MTTTVSQFVKGQIKSIQRGTYVLPNGVTSGVATISAVTPSKCELRLLGFKTTGADIGSVPLIYLSGATSITVERVATSAVTTVSWELTEYY